MFHKESLFEAVARSVKGMTASLALVSAGVNLLLLVTAIYMLQVYDRVLASGSLDTLVWLTLIALFAIAIYGVLEQARRVMLSRAALWADRELTGAVLERRMEAQLAGNEATAGPREVADLRNYYQSDAPLALHDAPWSLVFIAFIWSLHPTLGLVAVLGALVLMTLAIVNDVTLRGRQKRVSSEIRTINETALRYLDGGETIRPLGMAGRIFQSWRTRQTEARSREQEITERTTTILSLSKSIRLGLQVGILGTGAFLVLQGQISAGSMIAASIILGRALAPIERLTGAWRRFIAASTARKLLHACFDTLEDRKGGKKIELPRPKGDVLAERLWMTPQGSEEPILKDINFHLEPGKTLAIIGPSGSGKSSLCRLIVGAWRPTSGHLRLDGADVFDWAAAGLGEYVGYLPQKVELFPGTVGENIARFRNVESEWVVNAAKEAGVHEVILSLPQGYETLVDDRSSRIPLGQRQRIGLARALFDSPSMVVLDEPNSNLDRSGDDCLQKAVLALKSKGCTVIIVSHRAQILRHADFMMCLSEGRIEKYGKPKEAVQSVDADRRKTVQAVSAQANNT